MFLGSVPGEQFGVDGKQMQVRDIDVSWQLGKNQNVLKVHNRNHPNKRHYVKDEDQTKNIDQQ